MENKQIDLKELNVTELKALAFDTMVLIQNYQNALQTIQVEIRNRSLVQDDPKKEVKDAHKDKG